MSTNKSKYTAAQQLRPDEDDDDGMDFRTERAPMADRDQRDQRLGATDERTLSDEQRLELYRTQYMQARLPDLPLIPGFHVCWLSTTNQADSIQWRSRLGYVPVTQDDIPGFTHMTLRTGEFAGMIGVNEMLAYKVPDELYQMFMTEAHHNAPLKEDGKLTSQLDSLGEEAERMGGRLVEGDGMKMLREQRSQRAPRFA